MGWRLPTSFGSLSLPAGHPFSVSTTAVYFTLGTTDARQHARLGVFRRHCGQCHTYSSWAIQCHISRGWRVLLVDDQALLREGLRIALQAYGNIEVVGEASDGEEAIVAATRLQPTVVVMDINMAKMDGITATRLIKAQYLQMAVVGLSVEQKDYVLCSMAKAGASEVVAKETAAVHLYSAIV
jgi:CheY-like chemotaxis protein